MSMAQTTEVAGWLGLLFSMATACKFNLTILIVEHGFRIHFAKFSTGATVVIREKVCHVICLHRF